MKFLEFFLLSLFVAVYSNSTSHNLKWFDENCREITENHIHRSPRQARTRTLPGQFASAASCISAIGSKLGGAIGFGGNGGKNNLN